jgi:predicted nucleic acid-binding Zn ribbon protein
VSPWRPLPRGGSGASDDGRDPRPVAESLPRFTRRLGGTSPAALSAVFTRWEEIVGTPVAANAWPVSLTRGVLVIGVEHPGWATQLRFMTADITARVAAVSGTDAVEQVEIKVGPRRPDNGVT